MGIRIQHAVEIHLAGRLEEAEQLYRSILKIYPKNLTVINNLGLILHHHTKFDQAVACFRKAIKLKPDYYLAHNNLGNTMKDLGKFDQAEACFRKVLEIKPDCVDAYFGLGTTLKNLYRFDEAEANFRKAIKFKPDCVEAYNSLGTTLKNFDKFDEAEASFRKAIELKPDYYLAHNNLGNTMKNLGKFNEAEASFRKAIELKPDYIDANKNLDLLIKHKKLLSRIERAKKFKLKTKINFPKKISSKSLVSDLRLTSNPFILNRKVEAELISQLYKINTKKLDDVDPGLLRYGNGKSSDYELFENNFSIIKTLEKDLISILKEAVKSDIFIMESFFNIFKTESGIVFHDHLINFDKIHGLIEQKFSLTYYLEVGDQNCSQPGTLKLQDPDKEILPSNGMMIIFPASRKHSAVYNGKTDRIMIGVNFYSLI